MILSLLNSVFARYQAQPHSIVAACYWYDIPARGKHALTLFVNLNKFKSKGNKKRLLNTLANKFTLRHNFHEFWYTETQIDGSRRTVQSDFLLFSFLFLFVSLFFVLFCFFPFIQQNNNQVKTCDMLFFYLKGIFEESYTGDKLSYGS